VLLCTPPLPGGPGGGLGRELAARLNLPPAVQADLLLAACEGGGGGGGGGGGEEAEGGKPAVAAGATPWWGAAVPSLAPAFMSLSATLAAALGADLARGVRDGKAVVLEGCALDPLALAAAVREGSGGGGEGAGGGASPGAHPPHPPPIILPVLVRLTDGDRALLAGEACERDPVSFLNGGREGNGRRGGG